MTSDILSFNVNIKPWRTWTVDVQDLREIIHLCLHQNSIPVELTYLVNSYYGEFASVENEAFEIIARHMQLDVLNAYRSTHLPYADYSPDEFTAMVGFYFGIYVSKKYDQNSCLIINPSIFYKTYTRLFPNTVIPVRNRNSIPSLIPPMPYVRIVEIEDDFEF